MRLARRRKRRHIAPMSRRLLLPALLLAAVTGCEPTVRLEAPKEPIVITLNVNIQQEVRVKVERELDQVFQNNEGIF